MTPDRAAAIVPAAGRGERLGPGAPKAMRILGGLPILVHAVRALAGARGLGLVVVVAPATEVAEVRSMLLEHNASVGADLLVVAGGDTRQDSVAAGVSALPADVGIVLVHDAARPLVPAGLIEAVLDAVRSGAGAVVPGIPLADTVKVVDAAGRVEATPDRASMRAVQTPQGFRREVLVHAHVTARVGDHVGEVATDDAGLVERAGGTVLVIPGSDEAFKITRPMDLVFAETVLARRRAAGVVV